MNELKYACADFTFPLLKHNQVLDVIALLGFQGIDIGLFNGRSHLQPETEFKDLKASAARLKKQLGDKGLIPSDVFLQLDTDLSAKAINHPEPKIRQFAREQFLKLMEYSMELGADHITCLPGMFFPNQEDEKSLALIYEELAWRVEQVRQTPLNFGVEAHIGSPFMYPEACLQMVQSVDGLCLTLDYTHFIKEGFAQEAADILLPYANHFHARGAKKGRLQASMKENVIDYPTIVQKLRQQQYNGWIGLEFIWIDWERCNEVDTLSETILLKENLVQAGIKVV